MAENNMLVLDLFHSTEICSDLRSGFHSTEMNINSVLHGLSCAMKTDSAFATTKYCKPKHNDFSFRLCSTSSCSLCFGLSVQLLAQYK